MSLQLVIDIMTRAGENKNVWFTSKVTY